MTENFENTGGGDLAIVTADPGDKPAVRDNGEMPAFPTKAQIDEYAQFLAHYNEFIDQQLKEKTDYDKIPGTDRPTLLKPGAEKLEKLFFLTHRKECTEKIVRPEYIKYTYKTIVYDKNGNAKATCEGTCNSKENKYRYSNISERDATPEQKQQGKPIVKTGKYGQYKVYRIEKTDFFDVENTIMKMAQKRSYVGAILEATGSSGRFTQDIEDMPPYNPPNVANSVKATGYVRDGGYKRYKPAQPANGNGNNVATPNLNRLKGILRNEGVSLTDPRAVKDAIENLAGIRVDGQINETKAAEILTMMTK